MRTQNLWGAAKATLRRKFIAIQPYLKKQASSRQPNFTPKTIGKRKAKNTPRINRKKEIIKIKAEINEMKQ